MSAPFTRSSLARGPAIVTYNSGTFFTRGDVVPRHAPAWDDVVTSMYGRVDRSKKDLIIKISLPLWSSLDNLAILFPPAVMTPLAGTSVFGASDLGLVIHARNGDQITYVNTALTKLSNLHLGTDNELWSADAEFTALIANGANPEDAGAYYTMATPTYTDTAFAKTNFSRVRWTGAWGTVPGFTTIVSQKGFSIDWDLKLSPIYVEGYGTRDMTVVDMVATCKCIPVGPTIAQLEAAAQALGTAMGSLLSAVPATLSDLTLTGGAHSVILKSAAIIEHGYAFGQDPLRLGEFTWSTTRGFSVGVPAAVAAVS